MVEISLIMDAEDHSEYIELEVTLHIPPSWSFDELSDVEVTAYSTPLVILVSDTTDVSHAFEDVSLVIEVTDEADQGGDSLLYGSDQRLDVCDVVDDSVCTILNAVVWNAESVVQTDDASLPTFHEVGEADTSLIDVIDEA